MGAEGKLESWIREGGHLGRASRGYTFFDTSSRTTAYTRRWTDNLKSGFAKKYICNFVSKSKNDFCRHMWLLQRMFSPQMAAVSFAWSLRHVCNAGNSSKHICAKDSPHHHQSVRGTQMLCRKSLSVGFQLATNRRKVRSPGICNCVVRFIQLSKS